MDTILIIDDDEGIRETLYIGLKELKARIFLAHNGRMGIQILKKERPGLVITDMRMPGFSGLDVLRETREFSNDTPVILITAFDDMILTAKARQMGAYECMEKPLDIPKFQITVIQALESRRLAAEVLNDRIKSVILGKEAERSSALHLFLIILHCFRKVALYSIYSGLIRRVIA